MRCRYVERANELAALLAAEVDLHVWCLQEMWFELSWLEPFERDLSSRYATYVRYLRSCLNCLAASAANPQVRHAQAQAPRNQTRWTDNARVASLGVCVVLCCNRRACVAYRCVTAFTQCAGARNPLVCRCQPTRSAAAAFETNQRAEGAVHSRPRQVWKTHADQLAFLRAAQVLVVNTQLSQPHSQVDHDMRLRQTKELIAKIDQLAKRHAVPIACSCTRPCG